jgi:asparagine synthase (glutamine-hydrolysing)
MSGICGIVNFDGAPVRPEVLEKMAEAAAHRGPDGIRYWREGSAGLANLALNITPESFHERQPLVCRRGDLVLTADARVDNRDELVRTLAAKKYLQDKDPTDADVILAAYQCWEMACPAHIIGDFAFVIWDARRRRLFAAREPQGTRSLYYRVEPRRVLFATEVKQILAVPDVPARIFEPAVGSFLAGEAGMQEWTYYEGIAALPPACAFAADATGYRTWRYWDIDPDFRIEYGNEQQYAEHFMEVFEEAVRSRLRSAKPVGIFLSGGMDSGSVAATAGWLLQRNGATSHPGFRAYSWAFEELAQCDERHISDGIVHHYGLPVTYVPADTAWPLGDYPAHGPDRDDPYLPFFRVLADRTLEEARAEGMGWMLTGGLGDLMVGSDIFDYLDQLREGQWRRLWSELRVHGRLWGIRRRRLVQMYMWNPLEASLWPQGRAARLTRHAWHRALRRPQPYPAWIRPEFARRIGLADIIHDSVPRSSIRGFGRRKRYEAAFSSVSTQDIVGWERSNARFGLGDADPYSDRRVVSFVIAVPPRVLNRAGELKLLVRRSMRGIMPEEVRRAAGKILPAPLLEVAIKRRARETVQDLITDPRAEAYGFIDGRTFATQVEAYRRGEHSQLYFWFTLALEMWLRKYWS